jgi:hypothetical protein
VNNNNKFKYLLIVRYALETLILYSELVALIQLAGQNTFLCPLRSKGHGKRFYLFFGVSVSTRPKLGSSKKIRFKQNFALGTRRVAEGQSRSDRPAVSPGRARPRRGNAQENS